MGVSTIFALMTGVVAAKLRPSPPDVEITKLKTQVDDLHRQFDELLADVTRQRDEWQRMAEAWRERYYTATQPEAREQRIAQAQAQQLMALAYQQQANFNAQQAQQNLANQQFGAYQGFCNCVPARHDAFINGLGG